MQPIEPDSIVDDDRRPRRFIRSLMLVAAVSVGLWSALVIVLLRLV